MRRRMDNDLAIPIYTSRIERSKSLEAVEVVADVEWIATGRGRITEQEETSFDLFRLSFMRLVPLREFHPYRAFGGLLSCRAFWVSSCVCLWSW